MTHASAQLQLLEAPPFAAARAVLPDVRNARVDGAEGGAGSNSALNLSPTNATKNLKIWKDFLRNFGDDFRTNWQQHEKDYYARFARGLKLWREKGGTAHDFWREVGKTDLYYLTKHILPYNKLTFHLHFPICRFLELNELRYKFLMIPRFHYKSTIGHARRVQLILNNPDIAILIGTGTTNLVRGFCGEMKALFEHCENFREFYPEFCPPPNSHDWGTMDHFTVPNRKQQWRKEPTLQVATTGMKQAGNHYDIIEGDDLVNDENANSTELLAEIKRWYSDLPYLGPEDAALYNETLYGTRYSFADLYAERLGEKLEDGGRFACYVRHAEENGQALCPEIRTWDQLQAMRGTSPEARDRYAAQMMMDPVSEAASLKRTDIEYYAGHSDDYLRDCHLYLSLDAAISKSERADSCGFVVSAATPDGFLDVIEAQKARLTEKEFVAELFRLWDKYKPLGRFQAITLQKAVIEQVFRTAIAEEEERRKEYLPIVAINVHKRDKTERIRRIMPRFQNKKARILACHVELETELVQFPKGAHDDLIDPLSDVEEVIEFPKVEPKAEPKKEYAGTTFNEAHKILSHEVWESARHQTRQRREAELMGVAA